MQCNGSSGSGIPADLISEVHGNLYIEICDTCKKEYLRSYDVGTHPGKAIPRYDVHCTGRKCDDKKCKGALRDNIIHFGENLPMEAFQIAKEHSMKADLAVVIGTSLQVRPAYKLPVMCAKNGGKMVIINLQKTPKDKHASLRIFGECDPVMTMLMQELGIEIPKFEPMEHKKIMIGNTWTKIDEKINEWEIFVETADRKVTSEMMLSNHKNH